MERGHDVVGLDTGFYREGWLFNMGGQSPATIHRDIRDIERADLVGFDSIVHLAELSNDPLGKLQPEVTYRINYQGSLQLARNAKSAGIRRFVYASSCSVYGIGSGDFKDESSAVNPQTAYAECKALVERGVSELASGAFSPTFLRNATAYGPSPRMRFDIVLNNLMGLAWTTGDIRLTSDGSPWRPLVHVDDICRAVTSVLKAPRERVHNEILNVGSTEENYQIRDLAEIVAETVPGCSLTIGAKDGDNRSYRVSFDKIVEQLPDFRCHWTVPLGAHQLRRLFEKIDLSQELFETRSYTRLKQISHLLETEQIDDSFNWTAWNEE
jgi:nucleoside-diphosphate-sugar epimerase